WGADAGGAGIGASTAQAVEAANRATMRKSSQPNTPAPESCEGAHRASTPRRPDVGGRLPTRPPIAQTAALATPCEIEREPSSKDSGDAGERDRDPAHGAGGRGRRRADKAGCHARGQRQTTADAANRVLDRSGAEKVHLQLLAWSRTCRTLDRLDKSEDA